MKNLFLYNPVEVNLWWLSVTVTCGSIFCFHAKMVFVITEEKQIWSSVPVELETWCYGFCTVALFNSLLVTKLCSRLQLKVIKFSKMATWELQFQFKCTDGICTMEMMPVVLCHMLNCANSSQIRIPRVKSQSLLKSNTLT